MSNRITLRIWERTFELKVVYDCYEGENVTLLQNETVAVLEKDYTFINNSLYDVKKYCLDNYGDEVMGSDLDNIFKYVVPKEIFIKRNDKNHIFALMCYFKLDMEHDLAIVFNENKLSMIGLEDIIL